MFSINGENDMGITEMSMMVNVNVNDDENEDDDNYHNVKGAVSNLLPGNIKLKCLQ